MNVRQEIGPELPGGHERVEVLFRCGSREYNEEGEQLAQGKPGLPGAIRAARGRGEMRIYGAEDPSVSSSAVQGKEKFEPRVGLGWNWKKKIDSPGAS